MMQAGISLSLATVYNALNQFTSAGLLRKISIPGEQTYYDTVPKSHQHFYIDIPAGTIRFRELPAPPEGYAISNVKVYNPAQTHQLEQKCLIMRRYIFQELISIKFPD